MHEEKHIRKVFTSFFSYFSGELMIYQGYVNVYKHSYLKMRNLSSGPIYKKHFCISGKYQVFLLDEGSLLLVADLETEKNSMVMYHNIRGVFLKSSLEIPMQNDIQYLNVSWSGLWIILGAVSGKEGISHPSCFVVKWTATAVTLTGKGSLVILTEWKYKCVCGQCFIFSYPLFHTFLLNTVSKCQKILTLSMLHI